MVWSRRTKIFIAFLAVVVGGYFLVNVIGGLGRGVPKEFYDARLQGALIAQKIVNLSNQASTDLRKINELDQTGEFTEALNLTSQVVTQSQEIRDQAVALSGEIEKMTKALSSIRSLEARQAALEAITHRLALISRLINYSASLSRLLDTLRDRFSGKNSRKGVASLIGQLNAEVTAINSFNSQAALAMERFDKLVR